MVAFPEEFAFITEDVLLSADLGGWMSSYIRSSFITIKTSLEQASRPYAIPVYRKQWNKTPALHLNKKTSIEMQSIRLYSLVIFNRWV